jgi:hypothetical protein
MAVSQMLLHNLRVRALVDENRCCDVPHFVKAQVAVASFMRGLNGQRVSLKTNGSHTRRNGERTARASWDQQLNRNPTARPGHAASGHIIPLSRISRA